MNAVERLKRFTTKTTNIKNSPGCWDSLLVEIFENEVKIGEYTRNYSSMYNTFVPFAQNGKEYALYSRHYTATRIMSLPDCKDLGGEEPCGFGFCPTGYYVPYDTCIDEPNDPNDSEEDIYKYNTYGPRGDFGFVCGCVWGDDSGGWKVQFLDLRNAAEGKIIRDQRFGYTEMSPSLSASELDKAIWVHDYSKEEWDKDVLCITIAGTKWYTLDGTQRGSSILEIHCPKCNRSNSLRTKYINDNYKQTLFEDKVVCPYCNHTESFK